MSLDDLAEAARERDALRDRLSSQVDTIDALIVYTRSSGHTWAEVAAAAGMSVTAARKAYARWGQS